MKKYLVLFFAVAMVFGLMGGMTYAQDYGLDVDGDGAGDDCALAMDKGEQVCIDIYVNSSPAILTTGFEMKYNGTKIQIDSVNVYDNTSGYMGPYDSDLSVLVPNVFPDNSGLQGVACGSLASVAAGNQKLAEVCFTALAAGDPGITVTTLLTPPFDTIVGDSTVYDPQTSVIAPPASALCALPAGCVCEFVVTITEPPCTCSITGPATIAADALAPVTEDYEISNPGPPLCPNTAVYDWEIDCPVIAGVTIDDDGLVTVPATTSSDTCMITVTDTANSDINTGLEVVCEYEIEIEGGSVCATEIALGRFCPTGEVPDPAFNRPGRRGIAATCGDIIDFTVCSDNETFDPACLTWTITPTPPPDTTLVKVVDLDCCWRLTIGDSCEQLDKIATYTVTVSDSCCFSTDSVEIQVGKVIVDIGETIIQPNTEAATVDVDLTNLDHYVRALTMDIAECDGGADNLVCTECVADPDRAMQFTCSANEQADGTCRIFMYATNPSTLITPGRGTIAQVIYEAGDELTDLCGSDACVCLEAENIQMTNQFNEELCACEVDGEVCFRTCGDIFPRDCIGGTCGALTCCGDGSVDLFDILEGVDIILGFYDDPATPAFEGASECQLGNGDVPNGMPPYCGDPAGSTNCEADGDFDIFDVVVMIDKALGKANCCDYCYFGEIY